MLWLAVPRSMSPAHQFSSAHFSSFLIASSKSSLLLLPGNMEGLGIAANVIAVVDLAKAAKDCPERVEQLQQQLWAIREALQGLRRIADRLEAANKATGEPSPSIANLPVALKVSEYLRLHTDLSHYSIDKKDTPQAEVRLAKVVLQYLLLEDFAQPCISDKKLELRLANYMFYEYCAFNWFEHIQNAKTEDEDLFELCRAFVFGSPGNLRSYEQMMARLFHVSNDIKERSPELLYRGDNDQDHELSCALFYHAIRNGPRWITRRILEDRPDLLDSDIRGYGTPLQIATLNRDPELVRDILNMGIDANTHYAPRDWAEPLYVTAIGRGWRPRSLRIQTHIFGDCVMYDMFLKYTIKPPKRINARANSPFECIIHLASMYAPAVVPVILEHGSDPNLRADDGSTPMHYAIMGGNADAVRILVEAGVDINVETYSGSTPFHVALGIGSRNSLWWELAQILGASTAHEFPFEAFAGEDFKIPPSSGAEKPVPKNWIRSAAIRTSGTMREPEDVPFGVKGPYVSIAVKQGLLKRIVFKLAAHLGRERDPGNYIVVTPSCLFLH
jgi:hypothetical protein